MKNKNIVIIAVIIIAAPATFYGVTAYKKGQQPGNAVNATATDTTSGGIGQGAKKPDSTARLADIKDGIAQGDDPCKGTGGTGQIVSIEDSSITIKRHDGKNEIIKLTGKTMIKNAGGPVDKSALKVGDKVTVVVMAKRTATAVMVCKEQGPQPGKDIGG